MPKEKTYPEGLKRISVNLTTEQAEFVEAYILEKAKNGERVTVTDVIRLSLDKLAALETETPNN